MRETRRVYGEYRLTREDVLGARKFNEVDGRGTLPVYGCVTTGETWQFLQLADHAVVLDRDRYYLDNVPRILGAFLAICNDFSVSTK